MAQLARALEAKAAHQARLLARGNVVSVGVGRKATGGTDTGQPAVVVGVARKLPAEAVAARDLVPRVVGGVETDVVEVGVIRALAIDRTAHWRPAPGGVSIGHFAITAGTLGCVVWREGRRFILSNNHVLANSNDAEPGDEIVQPGMADDPGADCIGRLSSFVPITFAGAGEICPMAQRAADAANSLARLLGSGWRLAPARPLALNLVDAALALPDDDADVLDTILEIGDVTGMADVGLGDGVQKSGRTTGLTLGEVSQIDVTVSVSYGGLRIAMFEDCLLSTTMASAGGDSGSLVLDAAQRVVGLLFAGSESTTVWCRAANVAQALGVTFGSGA